MAAFDEIVEKVRLASELEPNRVGSRGIYFNDAAEPVCLLGWALDALEYFYFKGLDVREYSALNHSPVHRLLVSDAKTPADFAQLAWLGDCQFNQDHGKVWSECVRLADGGLVVEVRKDSPASELAETS